MKKIFLLITMFLNINSFAGSLDSFTISNAKGHFATAFLVTGGQGLTGGFEVQRVYRKIGTFRASAGYVEIPNSTFQNYGWRGPSHVLVLTHNQSELALNKIQSDNLLKFEDPTYSIKSDRVYPNGNNLKYLSRKAILIKNVQYSSQFLF